MEVHGHPGLYVFGELLDFTGPIGGLSFQAAFATANLAARHAARIVEERSTAGTGRRQQAAREKEK
jgi:hypothetical protein